MKRKMQKLMGVGLTVVLLVSMLVAVAPASAGTLGFSATTDIPDATNKMVITAGDEIVDIAVATGGERIYAAVKSVTVANSALYKSSDGGTSWSLLTMPTAVTGSVALVAVAPDDEDIVVVACNTLALTTNLSVYASTDAGANWNDLGTVQEAATGYDATQINDIAISALSSGKRLVAAAGKGVTGAPAVTFPGVFYFDLGATAPVWKNAANADFTAPISNTGSAPDALAMEAFAVAFSPNYPSDMILTAITHETAAASATAAATVLGGVAAVGNMNGNSYTITAADVIKATSTGIFELSCPTATPAAWALTGLQDAGPAGSIYFLPGTVLTASTLGGGAVAAGVGVGMSYVITAGDTIGAGSVIYARLTCATATVADNIITNLVGAGNTIKFASSAARFNMISFNQKKWNAAAGFGAYPVALETLTTAVMPIVSADISVDPEYLGGDDTTRIAFVGMSLTKAAVEAGGTYRLKDTALLEINAAVGITSVAWDGTNLAAGASLTNNVYRSADALATLPAVSTSRGNKEIGVDGAGNDNVIVRWAGSNLVGGKSVAAAGFGKSTDNGKTWNGIALIESALTNMRDVWVSPDGSVVYLLTDDGAEVSLFRKADSAWTRVFCFADTTSTGYIVRAADSNPDVVYIAERLTSNMYFSTDGGTEKWTVRASSYTIQDLAVQDADIAYVGESATAKVSKTTNGGFTWATTVSTSLGAGNIHSMTLISEDNLLVGSTLGYVAYTTDGNVTWNDLSDKVLNQALLVQVTATGLADGDYIFASTTGAIDADVERWQIGTSTDWKDMADTMSTTIVGGTPGTDILGCFGIDYQDGVLYAVASDGTDSAIFRNANTEAASPSAADWTVAYEIGDTFNNAPSSLRLNSGSTLLWAVESTATELHTFTDSLVGVPPTLVFPAVGYQNPVNPVSGNSMDVAFKWEKPISGTAGYQIKVCTDAAGDVALTTHVVATSESGSRTVLMGPNQLLTQSVSFAPGQTYYWTVRVNTPAIGPWAPIRSFTIETLQAAVPQVLAPENGTMGASTTPSFSWAPISGTSEYRFKLADNVALANAIVDVKVKSTGYALATKELDKGKTYYWAVMPVAPVMGAWSAIANFTVAQDVTPSAPPVVIQQVPPPVINIPAAPPQPADIIIPPAPPAPAPITPAYIWAIIIIGAVLVIAVIVLIVRTRRTV